MISSQDLKVLYDAYVTADDKATAKQNILDELNANLKDLAELNIKMSEPVWSTQFDVTAQRNNLRQLLTQLEVKLQEQITLVTNDEINWSTELGALFNEYSANEFNKSNFSMTNFMQPNVLDINLWIRSGKVATPLNDMIWRPTKRYDEGDIVMTFMDGIFYTQKDPAGNTDNTWKFKTKGFDKYQGIDLRPVYFICKKGNVGQSPWNSEMGKMLVKNSINYYAVEITSIITIGNSMAFATKWFRNKEYWEVITDLNILMTIWKDYNTPCGNLMSSTNFIINNLWPASIGWSTNVNEYSHNVLFCSSYGLGCYKVAHSWTGASMDYGKFPAFKTTKETTFEAAYANWSK